jgi:hypothetical protein
MLARIISTYLGVIIVAHAAELLTSYSLAFFVILTLIQVIGYPLMCRCARRLGTTQGYTIGYSQGYDRGLEEAEQIITAELECRAVMIAAHADVAVE